MLVKQIAFQNIKDFSRESKCAEGRRFCGVFLWGFSLDKEFEKPSDSKKFVPYGIGNASEPNASVYDSIFKVLALLAGGYLPVFDILGANDKGIDTINFGEIREKYRQFLLRTDKSEEERIALPNAADFPHLLYYPVGIQSIEKFISSAEIQSTIKWMMTQFCVMIFHPMPESSTVEDFYNLENCIAQLVGHEKLISSHQADTDLHITIDCNSEPIEVSQYDHLFRKDRGSISGRKFGF
jgi:hypothetical protein